MGFLEDWDLGYDEINELLTANPSLRSFVMGYAAEVKCRNMYFRDHP
ncbi:MAG: restriction endonuclease, partial [Saccharothrix sp.]|nr:restriction endonuclease [Saccharothrix sp.]